MNKTVFILYDEAREGYLWSTQYGSVHEDPVDGAIYKSDSRARKARAVANERKRYAFDKTDDLPHDRVVIHEFKLARVVKTEI